jgi:hypothetical protein
VLKELHLLQLVRILCCCIPGVSVHHWRRAPFGSRLPHSTVSSQPPLETPCIAPGLQMVFGKRPPSLYQDPVAAQPCLAACATAIASGSRCHKLD